MTVVAIRDLRNHTAQVIDKARAGETVILTSRGENIARIVPIDGHLRAFLTPQEVLQIPQADPGLRDDLAAMGDDSTDGLGAIQ